MKKHPGVPGAPHLRRLIDEIVTVLGRGFEAGRPLVPSIHSAHVWAMGRTGRVSAAFLLAAWGLGCSREAANSVTRTLNLPLFTAADSAVLEIPQGLVQGGRLIGAYALNDTTIAVVSSGPGGVALLHRDGAPMGSVRSLGTARPAYVAPCTQGGVAIITEGERQVIALRADGMAASRWRIPPSLGTILGAQCESARDIVALVDGTLPTTPGAALVRVGSALVHLSNAGQRMDTLASFPGRELLRFSPSEPGVEPPFGIATRFAAGPTRLYLANTNEATIQEFQTNGRRLGTIDVVGESRRVSRTQVDSALRARFGRRLSDLSAEAFREMVNAMARERTVPLWSALAVDPDENVWVAANEPPDKDGDRAWVVYTVGGSRRAKVFLPHDFEVTEVGRNYVLGFLRSAPPTHAARRYGLQLLGG